MSNMVTSTAGSGPKILIVEDHPIVSESLFHLVSETFENVVCVHAPTGMKGLACLNSNIFDVVLLDINLPDITGIDFCRRGRSLRPDLKVLVVTSMAQRHIVEEALIAGVTGFVLKTSDIRDITEGIRQVMSGNRYLGKGVKELLNKSGAGGTINPQVTKREREILKLIAEGNTNQEIAGRLFISTSTVDSHRKNLLLKFNARNTAALVKQAITDGVI